MRLPLLFFIMADMLFVAHFYPTGAPLEVCQSMMPKHQAPSIFPDKEGPVVRLSRISNVQGKSTVGYIRSGTDQLIKGFLLQARDRNQRPVGEFVKLYPGTKIIVCGNGQALTHSESLKHDRVLFWWKPPASATKVIFLATVVVNMTLSYVGIASQEITVIDANSTSPGTGECPTPPDVENAVVTVTGDSILQARYECYPGYLETGNNTAYCASTTWSEVTFKCTGECPTPPDVENAMVTVTGDSLLQARYECYPGYLETGNNTAYCASTTWSEVTVKCTGECPPPPDVENAVVTVTGDSLLQARYECYPGYLETGNNTAYCASTTWSEVTVKCTEDCGEPPQIAEATATVYRSNESIIATYRCQGEFVSRGPTTIRCLPPGLWEQPNVLCVLACGPHPEVSNTMVSMYMLYQDEQRATYECLPGFIGNGLDSVMCIEGIWDDVSFSCTAVSMTSITPTPTSGSVSSNQPSLTAMTGQPSVTMFTQVLSVPPQLFSTTFTPEIRPSSTLTTDAMITTRSEVMYNATRSFLISRTTTSLSYVPASTSPLINTESSVSKMSTFSPSSLPYTLDFTSMSSLPYTLDSTSMLKSYLPEYLTSNIPPIVHTEISDLMSSYQSTITTSLYSPQSSPRTTRLTQTGSVSSSPSGTTYVTAATTWSYGTDHFATDSAPTDLPTSTVSISEHLHTSYSSAHHMSSMASSQLSKTDSAPTDLPTSTVSISEHLHTSHSSVHHMSSMASSEVSKTDFYISSEATIYSTFSDISPDISETGLSKSQMTSLSTFELAPTSYFTEKPYSATTKDLKTDFHGTSLQATATKRLEENTEVYATDDYSTTVLSRVFAARSSTTELPEVNTFSTPTRVCSAGSMTSVPLTTDSTITEPTHPLTTRSTVTKLTHTVTTYPESTEVTHHTDPLTRGLVTTEVTHALSKELAATETVHHLRTLDATPTYYTYTTTSQKAYIESTVLSTADIYSTDALETESTPTERYRTDVYSNTEPGDLEPTSTLTQPVMFASDLPTFGPTTKEMVKATTKKSGPKITTLPTDKKPVDRTPSWDGGGSSGVFPAGGAGGSSGVFPAGGAGGSTLAVCLCVLLSWTSAHIKH